MGGLTVEQFIKIIIGLLVVVAVIIGLYFFFKDYVMDFFKNLPSGEFFLGILK